MKPFLNSKGQGSLEIMLISTAVIVMAFLFTSIFLTSQDSTTATVIAKNRLTEVLNTLDRPVIIQNINYTIASDNQIQITVTPSDNLTDGECNTITLQLPAIQTEIIGKTNFPAAVISVRKNSTIFC